MLTKKREAKKFIEGVALADRSVMCERMVVPEGIEGGLFGGLPLPSAPL